MGRPLPPWTLASVSGWHPQADPHPCCGGRGESRREVGKSCLGFLLLRSKGINHPDKRDLAKAGFKAQHKKARAMQAVKAEFPRQTGEMGSSGMKRDWAAPQ